jgi:hypothetical protein
MHAGRRPPRDRGCAGVAAARTRGAFAMQSNVVPPPTLHGEIRFHEATRAATADAVRAEAPGGRTRTQNTCTKQSRRLLMSTMTDIRRQAIGIAVASGMVLTVGGPLNAATPPSDAAPQMVPVSPSEGAPKELSAPPAEAGTMSLPADVRPGTKVFEKLLPGDADARAGHKLPCGLSYFENPPNGKYKVVVYTIGNCHDEHVSRAIDFDPDKPEPRTACVGIPAHHKVIGAWAIGRDQHVSGRGTGMIACG